MFRGLISGAVYIISHTIQRGSKGVAFVARGETPSYYYNLFMR